jgi:hypothetical protein
MSEPFRLRVSGEPPNGAQGPSERTIRAVTASSFDEKIAIINW